MHFGPRDLIYRKRIYQEILTKIKEKDENISSDKLESIEKSLWLIMEGIISHNGERSEFEYQANSGKTESDFIGELMRCHTEKGYDRKMVPATPEAALMRLCDKISYVPYDMVDGIREGFITGLNEEYTQILKEFGMTEKQIQDCQENGDYEPIAKQIQTILMQDVIKETKAGARDLAHKKHKPILKSEIVIKMSKEKANLMHRLRDINNKQIVDYVVLQEDSDVYVPAIGTLMDEFKTFLQENGLDEKLATGLDAKETEDLQTKFGKTKYANFVDFILSFTPEEYGFIQKMLRAAREQAATDELAIARDIVLNRKNIDQVVNPEIFPNKNNRIQKLTQNYQQYELREEMTPKSPHKPSKKVTYLTIEGKKVEYTDAVDKAIKKKSKSDFIPLKEGLSYEIGARYLSTLDDKQFLQTLLDFAIIDSEKLASLTKKYREFGVEELRKRVYKDPNWAKVEKAQKQATEQAMK